MTLTAPPRQRRSLPPAPPAGGGRAPGRLPHPARRIVMGVLVGSLTMFAVATVDVVTDAEVPLLGSIAALPSTPDEPEQIEAQAPPAVPGTCLNWVRPDAADTAVVDCALPHLFEQAGSVVLADQTVVPDDGQWRQLVKERCTPLVTSYLDGKFDPDGRYRVGALKPSQAKWDQGDRELRCGLQSASRSGALYPTTGRVADNDQSAVFEPGTCLAIDGKTIGDPVDCEGQHAVEVVGIVDLSEKFPEGFPAVGDQDGFLQPECSRVAGEYAGGEKVIADKGLTVYWDNLTQESWDAGSRKVNCNLGALLPDRSGFAPVTGPVTGEVSVGAEPAPPATSTPEAGVPAPTTTSAAVPPESSAPAPGPGPEGGPAPGGGERPLDGLPELPLPESPLPELPLPLPEN